MVKFSIAELVEKLDGIIKENRRSTKLIKYMQEEFIKKGLLQQVPYQIFSDGLDLQDLDTINLIQFTKSIKEYTDNESLNLKNYFSDTELISYDTYVPIQEEAPEYVLFENVTKINAKSYMCPLYPTKSSELRRYRQFMYYKPAQRPAKNIIKKGKIVGTKANVNEKGVKDLEGRYIKGDIFPTQIAFSVLSYEGKKIGVIFEPYNEEIPNFGKLKIYLDWDKESLTYTPFISNDGYHRLTANANGYDVRLEATGEEIKTPLIAGINIMTEGEAKQYVYDSFKRNFADEDELKAIAPTNENNFIDNVIEKSDVLRDRVATTFKNIDLSDGYTSKDILSSTIKISKFDIVDEIEVEMQSDKCAKIIDLIINRLCKEYYNDNMKEMQESYLLLPNMFIGYLAIADTLKNDGKYISKLVKIVEELYLRTEEDITGLLKLKNKNCDKEIVYKYFQNLVTEVI